MSSLEGDTTAAMLAEQFQPFGELTQKITLRKKAGLLFGFVTLLVDGEEGVTHSLFFAFPFFFFSFFQGASRCLSTLHNSLWRGQRLRVERAKVDPDAERQRDSLRKFQERQAEKQKEQEKEKKDRADEGERKRGEDERRGDDHGERQRGPGLRVLEEARERELEAARERKKRRRAEEPAAKKVRVRPVADVAKATPWDAVLGHAWEERRADEFALLGEKEQREEEEERNFESVATRAFEREARREQQREGRAQNAQNPRLANFVSRVEGGEEKKEEKKEIPTTGMVVNFGEAFVRDEGEIEKVMEAWREERHELRKDFKSKKRKSEKSAKTSQKRK